MVKYLSWAAAVALVFGIWSGSAQAVTITGDFLADTAALDGLNGGDPEFGDPNFDDASTPLSLGDSLAVEISNSDGDLAGNSFAFAFTASEKLVGVETSSLNENPNTSPTGNGFLGASVSWSTDAAGIGILASISGTDLANGVPLSVIFGAAQTLFLIVEWDSIQGSNQNFDLRVAAVPLPAAAPLLASGLGLLGFAGWRRRRKAASPA